MTEDKSGEPEIWSDQTWALLPLFLFLPSSHLCPTSATSRFFSLQRTLPTATRSPLFHPPKPQKRHTPSTLLCNPRKSRTCHAVPPLSRSPSQPPSWWSSAYSATRLQQEAGPPLQMSSSGWSLKWRESLEWMKQTYIYIKTKPKEGFTIL